MGVKSFFGEREPCLPEVAAGGAVPDGRLGRAVGDRPSETPWVSLGLSGVGFLVIAVALLIGVVAAVKGFEPIPPACQRPNRDLACLALAAQKQAALYMGMVAASAFVAGMMFVGFGKVVSLLAEIRDRL